MTNIILGPPGTGKTTTLLGLIEAALERGTPPDRIALITFTRRGADEARERAMRRFNLEAKQLPYFSTIHALCYRQMGVSSGDVLTGKRLYDFADYARVRVTGRAWSDDGILTGFEAGDRILFMENLSRIRKVPLRQQYDLDDDRLNWNEVQRVAKALRVYKSSRGLLDFTDMLTEFVSQGQPLDVDELFVDESQDLSALQWDVVNLLASAAKTVTIAGDDDQAIYRWAGADVEHLVRMDGDVRVLGQSYRVPLKVQQLANAVVEPIKLRRPKSWKSKQGDDGIIDYRQMFSHVPIDEQWTDDTMPVMVLARNNYVLKEQVMPTLRQAGVVFEVDGKSSVDVKVLKAITTWESLRSGEAERLDDVRTMYGYISSSAAGIKRGYKNLPSYGDDPDEPVTMRDLVNTGGLCTDPARIWHEALDKLPTEEMSYLLAARQRGEKLRGGRPRVRLSTVHSAKGGEAHHVVLMKEIAQRSYAEMQRQPDDERRVWYVGATRAKHKLTIVESETQRECPWL